MKTIYAIQFERGSLNILFENKSDAEETLSRLSTSVYAVISERYLKEATKEHKMNIDIKEVLCKQCKYMTSSGELPSINGRKAQKIMHCIAPYPVFARPALGADGKGFSIIGTIMSDGCDLFTQIGDKDD